MDYVLSTGRLVLRPVTAGDYPVLLAHWTHPDVRRFLFDGALLPAAEVAGAIEDSIRDFAASGYGIWLIHEQGRAELAGTAGLRPLDDAGLEIFYSLAPGSWGRGYATEAARAVLDYALGSLGRRGHAARHDPVRRGARRPRSDDPLPRERLGIWVTRRRQPMAATVTAA